MDRLGLLKKQHRDMEELVGEIRNLSLREVKNKEWAREIRKKLSLLAGKLSIHIQREDDFLYPDLLKSDREDVKRITKEFIGEMGDLNKVFKKFDKKYLRATVISESSENFVDDLTVVLEKLEQRIEREDNNLYPLVIK